ncbi:MAG: hypothetical protein ACRCZ0_08605 [Cetobacterium sp.]
MKIKCLNNEGAEEYMGLGEVFEQVIDKDTHWKLNTSKGISIVVDKDRFEIIKD